MKLEPQNPIAELAAELVDVFNRLIELRVAERLKPLEEELQFIKSLQPEWVNSKEALRIIGRKKVQTLKAERERSGTIIVVKFEGKMNSTPLYLRSSLLEYNARKTKKQVPLLQLAA